MRFCCVFIIISALHISFDISASTITYTLNGGRFGDNLLSYSKAKWLSYKFSIPFCYIPFPYSDNLALSVRQKQYNSSISSMYDEKILLQKNKLPDLDPHKHCLYINQWYTVSDIDWNDTVFVEELKKDFTPLTTIDLIVPPKQCISIALHVRTGGNFTPDITEIERCKLRFVPIEFYIEQVMVLLDNHPTCHFYVHLFTDHSEPEQLIEQCRNAIKRDNVAFGYRNSGNSHNTYVLEDFFSMMHFTYLIRPGSHFSRFVERLGNNQHVIFPSHIKCHDKKYVIDEITIKNRTTHGRWETTVIKSTAH